LQEFRSGKCRECGTPLYNLQPTSTSGDEFSLLIPVNVDPISMIAGYLALFGILFVFLGPIVLGMGLVGLRRIRRDSKLRGVGRAWTAIVLGGLETVGFFLILILVVIQP
jgi:Domain of unknown function (DUF4190)